MCCMSARGAGATDSTLGLVAVAPSSKDGTFRIGQPLWISLGIVNGGKVSRTIRVDGSPDHGVDVSADPASSVDSTHRRYYIDRPYTEVQLGASQKHCADVLLNDFVTPRSEGEVVLTISVNVYQFNDGKAERVELHAPLKLVFKGRLDETNFATIVEPLRERYKGKLEAQYLVMREIAALDPRWRPTDVLNSAVLDPDLTVAIMAADALREIDSEPAREALRQGAHGSRHDFVRKACERALQKP